MSKYTYEEYIKLGCHPTGYNEPCQSYIFGQSTVDVLLTKIINLHAKLSEKEKEIKQLKLDLKMFASVNEFINRYGIEKAREVLLQSEKTKKQDKNSFAVEQLENLKYYCERKINEYEYLSTLEFEEIYGDSRQSLSAKRLQCSEISEYIDNKINELKEISKNE